MKIIGNLSHDHIIRFSRVEGDDEFMIACFNIVSGEEIIGEHREFLFVLLSNLKLGVSAPHQVAVIKEAIEEIRKVMRSDDFKSQCKMAKDLTNDKLRGDVLWMNSSEALLWIERPESRSGIIAAHKWTIS